MPDALNPRALLPQMLYALLGLLEHSRGNDLLQEQLLVTLREMAHKQTGMFEGHLENTISKLLLCCNRDQRQVPNSQAATIFALFKTCCGEVSVSISVEGFSVVVL